MKVALTPIEQRLAKALAEMRYSTQRANGVTDRRVSDKQETDIDLEGAGAEIALARVLNVYPDLDNKAGDEDLVLKDGRRVDVKSTRYKSGRLLAVPWKKGKPADLYVLLIGSFPEYRIAGWVTRDELFNDANRQSFGASQTKGFAVEQANLHSITDLQE